MKSGFPVKKELVIFAANAAVYDVEKRRLDSFNDAVNEKMNRRWFKPKSREEAERIVKDRDFLLQDWHRIGWRTLQIAKELLAAVSVVESGIVYLSAEEAAFVAKWKV